MGLSLNIVKLFDRERCLSPHDFAPPPPVAVGDQSLGSPAKHSHEAMSPVHHNESPIPTLRPTSIFEKKDRGKENDSSSTSSSITDRELSRSNIPLPKEKGKDTLSPTWRRFFKQCNAQGFPCYHAKEERKTISSHLPHQKHYDRLVHLLQHYLTCIEEDAPIVLINQEEEVQGDLIKEGDAFSHYRDGVRDILFLKSEEQYEDPKIRRELWKYLEQVIE